MKISVAEAWKALAHDDFEGFYLRIENVAYRVACGDYSLAEGSVSIGAIVDEAKARFEHMADEAQLWAERAKEQEQRADAAEQALDLFIRLANEQRRRSESWLRSN